jgi:hypothetical protein
MKQINVCLWLERIQQQRQQFAIGLMADLQVG